MQEILPPRITGTEMEWSITVPLRNCGQPESSMAMNSCEAGDHVQYYLDRHMGYMGKNHDFYLANGARLYMDVGEHLEYATPEDDSLMGTVANEIAGEQLLRRVFEKAAARPDSSLEEFSLNKRVIDDSGNVWGYHENYYSPGSAITISEAGLALLGVHLATRNIFFGAGVLRPDGHYRIAQKAGRLNCDSNSGTMHTTVPVVNLRKEPLTAESVNGQRVHVTSGDATMSPWATFMKLGTTSLVLRLMEAGQHMEWLRLKQSLKAVAAMVTHDTTLRTRLELENGKRLYAHEIQEALLSEARRLRGRRQLPEEEDMVLEEWQRAVDDAAEDPLLLADRADWAGKLVRLRRYRERHGLKWNDEELRRKDRQWDNIGPKGVGLIMRQTTWREWMPDQTLVDARMATPPGTTRAAVRGHFIDHFSGYSDASAGWDKVALNRHAYQLSDPSAAHHEQADRLMAILPRNSRVEASSAKALPPARRPA